MRVMGIVNVTPDSFSDGGRFLDPDAAVEHARRLAAAGADVIDIGGESTRPGARPVPPAEERARVVPVVAEVSRFVTVSVDTRRPGVAEAAIEAGAAMINDVSGTLAPVAAAAGVPWCVMHMRGEPRTMQDDPRYDDVVTEVLGWLEQRARRALDLGVPEVWIDPGIGFGKTVGHNVALLADIDRFVATGLPVLVGVSRKSTLGVLSAVAGAVPPPADRDDASAAVAVWLATRGVAMVRVHDVAGTRAALDVLEAAA